MSARTSGFPEATGIDQRHLHAQRQQALAEVLRFMALGVEGGEEMDAHAQMLSSAPC